MDTATFQPLGQRLAVYCGSRQGHHPSYAQMADSLGRAMAREGIDLVYGAADVGLMGRVANAVLAGEVGTCGQLCSHVNGTVMQKVCEAGCDAIGIAGLIKVRVNGR